MPGIEGTLGSTWRPKMVSKGPCLQYIGSPTCADGNVRTIKGTLFAVILPIHVLDSVFPLGVGGLLKRCDAGDWTPKFDQRTECKAVYVCSKILNILRQRYVIWGRQREPMIREGCQLLRRDQLGVFVRSILECTSNAFLTVRDLALTWRCNARGPTLQTVQLLSVDQV